MTKFIIHSERFDNARQVINVNTDDTIIFSSFQSEIDFTIDRSDKSLRLNSSDMWLGVDDIEKLIDFLQAAKEHLQK